MYNTLLALLDQNPHAIGGVLGLIAGLVVIGSGLPTIWAQFTSPYSGTKDQRQGHLYMAIGNLVLAVSSALTGSVSITGMALINAAIRLIIWVRMVWLTR